MIKTVKKYFQNVFEIINYIRLNALISKTTTIRFDTKNNISKTAFVVSKIKNPIAHRSTRVR